MKNRLDNIRKPKKEESLSKKIIASILILLLGVLLGIFSKWLDNMSIDDTIWWQNLLGILDLRNIFSEFGIWIFLAVLISVFSKTPLRASVNVFLFFLGMTSSYHLYTIYFSGFNPRSYMMIWYTITLITPILAYICWYVRGKGKIAIVIRAGILAVMLRFSFAIGIWYFDMKSIIDTLLFIGTVIVLYTDRKSSLISLLGAFLLVIVRRLLV